MSAQHTPGPWALTEKAVVASASTPIAHRVKWWSIGQLEIEENANARLIAAAPDLLETLQVFQTHLDSIASSDWRKWEELASPEEFERWVKSRASHMAALAREAIAKATGQKGGA